VMARVERARRDKHAGTRLAPMTEHDLVEVVEIEEMCGLSCWGWEAYYSELQRGDSGLMLVARSEIRWRGAGGRSIAGFVATRLIADELHINNIAVRTVFRRQGIGGALLSAVLTEGAQRGGHAALLEVRASNREAQELYERYGFRLIGRRESYYSGPSDDALIMRATL
jgi:[ribosomal protein S18]-alanine N-acetyltransferase